MLSRSGVAYPRALLDVDTTAHGTRFTDHIFRVGLNYHFYDPQ
jgi:hypothetical protein